MHAYLFLIGWSNDGERFEARAAKGLIPRDGEHACEWRLNLHITSAAPTTIPLRVHIPRVSGLLGRLRQFIEPSKGAPVVALRLHHPVERHYIAGLIHGIAAPGEACGHRAMVGSALALL
jgi:hypothetical protein